GLKKNSQMPVPDVEWGVIELSRRERERTGVLVTANPLSELHRQIDVWSDKYARHTARTVESVMRTGDGARVSVTGLVGSVTPITTRKGERMARMWLDGEDTEIECVIFPRSYREMVDNGGVPKPGALVAV